MSKRPGPPRSALLKEFRKVLVDEWPERISMETILSDAGLDAGKYIIDALRADDRWAQAIKRIDRDNKLMELISVVREYFDRENEAVEQLYAAEHAHVGHTVATQEPAGIATTASTPVGRIFICYRREDTAYPAGWLYGKLVEHFGRAQVFKDIDSILLGDDFVEKIAVAVGSCAVMLALIGNRWLTVTDDSGRPRLHDPGDFVRMEIEAALQRNVHVVPILFGGARMPGAAELPSSLAKLTYKQALELSDRRFDDDTGRLLRALDSMLGGGGFR
jgi:hypothetical protein